MCSSRTENSGIDGRFLSSRPRSGYPRGVGGERWNHNIHYHRIVLDAVPGHARSALDVGTGNGLLAADLCAEIPEVVAIDVDAEVLDVARQECDDVEWILGDVMAYPFERTFDVVASVATVHHLRDLASTLRRLAELTSPGGVLVVVGLARSTSPWEFAVGGLGVIQQKWLSWRRGYWEHTAPTVWPPSHSYSEVRKCAAEELPGVRWKLLPMFRYALIWRKPGDRSPSPS
ncbi:class I SAM-dependent methyltransferase [Nocardia sp. 004]|uniref:class I SAM-dependent methyltransferase n=1 Tax=Nocardia sp. 004 TaxID=3385978 RepID=UPI0039A1E68F